jgi:hypothetical protein
MVEPTSQMILDLPDLPLLDGADEVTALVSEALGRLRAADRRGAIWRLLDAAGKLCEQFPDDGTVRDGTDRGYRVVRSARDSAGSSASLQPALPGTEFPLSGHCHCAGGPAA